MPELGPKNIPPAELAEELKHRRGRQFEDWEALSLAYKYGAEFIGQGSECIVFSEAEREHQVITFNYHEISPEQVKKIFYLQRFFSTLFPHNFPRFSFAAATRESKPGVTIRERKHEDKALTERYYRRRAKLRHPIYEVVETCDDLGIKVLFDDVPDNFLITESGDQYYVDVLHTANFSEWDINKISEHMRGHGYTEEQIKQAVTAVKRLQTFPDTYYRDKKARDDFLDRMPG
jgi:hypothetical protein